MFTLVLVKGGIIAFIVLICICLLFGEDKAKKEATEAGEQAAGCGCPLIVLALVIIIFWTSKQSY